MQSILVPLLRVTKYKNYQFLIAKFWLNPNNTWVGLPDVDVWVVFRVRQQLALPQ